jgi:hypothetical protein
VKVVDYFEPCVRIFSAQAVLIFGLDVDVCRIGALRGFISVSLATLLLLIAGGQIVEAFIRRKLEEDAGGES